jgi:hypothetical protein
MIEARTASCVRPRSQVGRGPRRGPPAPQRGAFDTGSSIFPVRAPRPRGGPHGLGTPPLAQECGEDDTLTLLDAGAVAGSPHAAGAGLPSPFRLRAGDTPAAARCAAGRPGAGDWDGGTRRDSPPHGPGKLQSAGSGLTASLAQAAAVAAAAAATKPAGPSRPGSGGGGSSVSTPRAGGARPLPPLPPAGPGATDAPAAVPAATPVPPLRPLSAAASVASSLGTCSSLEPEEPPLASGPPPPRGACAAAPGAPEDATARAPSPPPRGALARDSLTALASDASSQQLTPAASEELWWAAPWAVGTHSEQNGRVHMEDRIVTCDVAGRPPFAGFRRAGFFAVFDG